MRRFILLMISAMLLSAVDAMANVTITVDAAQNVTMAGNNGNGTVVTLHDGTNIFSADELTELPYLIEPADGAKIESLTLNGNVMPTSQGTNNGYRFGISDNDEIVIVTSVAIQEADIWFSIDKMNSVKVSYNGQEVTNPSKITVEKGTELTIAPMPGYSISPSCMYGRVADNGDGTYRFIVNSDDTIWISSTVTGIQAELNLDFADNVEISFGTGLDQYFLSSFTNGQNVIVTDDSHLPLNISAANGATILSVSVNDSPWNKSGDGAYHLGLSDGDVIAVETQGRAFDVTFINQGTVGLENFNITIAGQKVDASGMGSVTAEGHLGDEITIAALPGTGINYVSPATQASDGSYSLILSEYNNQIYISGYEDTSVTISVDDASRVSVKQLDGYGDALDLISGNNKFDLENLQLPLKVSATDGNRIVSVTYNGEALTENNGAYNVNPAQGSRIAVISEKIPEAINVTITCPDYWEKVSATLNGEPFEIASDAFVAQIVPGSVLELSPAKGYEIAALSAPNNQVSGDRSGYRVVVNSPGTISIICQKMTAAEGYAIVTIESNTELWYSEYDENGNFQRYLDDKNAWEVKVGSTINIYTFNNACYFRSFTVNGEQVEADQDDRRSYHVAVNGDTEICIETYRKILITTERVNNSETMSVIGDLYVQDGDKKVTSYYADAGETVKFISEPAKGYKTDYISMIYPEGNDGQLTDSYTVTQEDVDNYELLVFRGTYSLIDDTKTLFVIEGNTTQTIIDGEYIKMGEVWPLDENGNSHLSVLAYEDDTIDFEIITEPGFSFENLSLFYDPEKVLDKPYTVNAEDAGDNNVISVVGIFSIGSNGIKDVAGDSGLSYHKASRELVSNQPIAIYDLTGTQVAYSTEGRIHLDGYAGGIYIAVSGNRAIKFSL